MIIKVKGGYKIKSHTGKLLGAKGGKPIKSKSSVRKREKQIRFFKNVSKSTGRLKAKVKKKGLLK